MPPTYGRDLTTSLPVPAEDRREPARPTLHGIPPPRLWPMHGTSLEPRHTVSTVPAQSRSSTLPRPAEATSDQPQETFEIPRSPRHGRIVQDTPEPGQVALSAELPRARRQDSKPATLPLLSLPRCMQTEPRVASMSLGLPVCRCFAVGR